MEQQCFELHKHTHKHTVTTVRTHDQSAISCTRQAVQAVHLEAVTVQVCHSRAQQRRQTLIVRLTAKCKRRKVTDFTTNNSQKSCKQW